VNCRDFVVPMYRKKNNQKRQCLRVSDKSTPVSYLARKCLKGLFGWSRPTCVNDAGCLSNGLSAGSRVAQIERCDPFSLEPENALDRRCARCDSPTLRHDKGECHRLCRLSGNLQQNLLRMNQPAGLIQITGLGELVVETHLHWIGHGHCFRARSRHDNSAVIEWRRK